VSSVELAREYLERLGTIGMEHRAVVMLLEDSALAAAREADKRFAAGKPRGPLDGVPFGIKDMFATKGLPTTWGSAAHQKQVFDYDAAVVKRLKAAGGVLVAKLAMIELAGGGNYNMAGASATGACLCAFDKQRWAGGSSSGSGAATALGCVGYALGSETWGSITCPSAFNGASGLRPTYGRVSRHGAMALAWSHDKIGCLARSVEDCGTVVSAMSGFDPNDPASVDAPSFRTGGGSRGKLRIGVLKEKFNENHASACEAAYKAALKVFEQFGYEIVEVAYPDLPYGTAMELIIGAEGASAHENFIRSERIHLLPDKDQVAGFLAALNTSAADYLWALRLRTKARAAEEVWKKCECVFSPVFYHAAPPATGKFTDTWKNMGGDDGPANLLGWPGSAFPIGMDDYVVPPPPPGEKSPAPAPEAKPGVEQEPPKDPGVSGAKAKALGYSPAPIGGQIVAPSFREDVCIRVARDFQRATSHHLRRPG